MLPASLELLQNMPIFGAVRDIPFWWRLIDCSFGVFGAIPFTDAIIARGGGEGVAGPGVAAARTGPG